jgi:hypothetical protein
MSARRGSKAAPTAAGIVGSRVGAKAVRTNGGVVLIRDTNDTAVLTQTVEHLSAPSTGRTPIDELVSHASTLAESMAAHSEPAGGDHAGYARECHDGEPAFERSVLPAFRFGNASDDDDDGARRAQSARPAMAASAAGGGGVPRFRLRGAPAGAVGSAAAAPLPPSRRMRFTLKEQHALEAGAQAAPFDFAAAFKPPESRRTGVVQLFGGGGDGGGAPRLPPPPAGNLRFAAHPPTSGGDSDDDDDYDGGGGGGGGRSAR